MTNASHLPDWVPGERVTVTIPGARIVEVDDSGPRRWLILDYIGDGLAANLHVPVDGKTVFERHTPADGEPRPGEIWADRHGNRYVAHADLNGVVELTPERVTKQLQDTRIPWKKIHTSREWGPITRIAKRPA